MMMFRSKDWFAVVAQAAAATAVSAAHEQLRCAFRGDAEGVRAANAAYNYFSRAAIEATREMFEEEEEP